MKKRINPIAARVVDTFSNVSLMVENFLTTQDTSVIRGIAIPGDAGLGKTFAIKTALKNAGKFDTADYVKGGSITPGALYAKLWLNRHKGDIIILDDVNLTDANSTNRWQLLEMIKGATDPDNEMRSVSWEVAKKNDLMKQHNIPSRFHFDGTLIWITNNTMEDIKRSCKSHFLGLFSRFQWAPCFFSEDERLQYTLHCIEEYEILGKGCDVGIKEGGFSDDVVQKTYDYIYDRYEKISDISPRAALKIADLIDRFPTKWESIVKTQCEGLF
jgi:hypothetical protein